MPVLAVGPNNTISSVVYGMKILAQNVQGIIVPNSGHWIAEEQPDFVIKLLNNFFSGKPAETSCCTQEVYPYRNRNKV
jgi:pimeloyl-ACP methyl ester carboxylesterase